jgi:hypothetical protein
MNRRDLTPIERNVLERMLSKNFPGSHELTKQLEGCLASDIGDNDNYGSIYLFPQKTDPASVERNVPVDGLVNDIDGSPINILLHIENGLLHELEIVKLDGSLIKTVIDPSKIEVILNQD